MPRPWLRHPAKHVPARTPTVCPATGERPYDSRERALSHLASLGVIGFRTSCLTATACAACRGWHVARDAA